MTTTEATPEAENEGQLRRIQGLLERAGHAETPEHEREACTAKADALMAKYRIDRAMLNFKHADQAREVVSRTQPRNRMDYAGLLNGMMTTIFSHSGCRTKIKWEEMTVVGYEEDIFFGEMLWINVQRDFVTKMFPKWESHRKFDENVFIIKNAGYSWPQVRDMGLEHEAGDGTGKLTEQNAGSKLRTAYKREAKRHGITVASGKQQPMNPKLYRDSFAESYYSRMLSRLAELARENDPGPGEYAIALQTDADRVARYFYELFPDDHPDAMAARNRIAAEEERKRRERLSEADRRREDREYERWTKKKPKIRYADQNGWSAGAKAADQVNLSRSNNVGTGRAGELG